MTSAGKSQLHFVLAALVLAGSAGALSQAKSRGWLVIIKKPLPIRKPLQDMEQKVFEPWRLNSAQKLPAESEEELGTKEYLNWMVSDPTGQGARSKPVFLTVTYYTGVQDQVPHVPEECAYQGGMSQNGGKQISKWDMPRLGERVEVSKLIFDSPRQLGQRLVVYYTIAVNGEFLGDRDPVRIRMTNRRDTHLYYAKTEVSINTSTDANQAELDAIGRDLMDRTLTELMHSHLPLRGWEQGGPK